MDQATQQPKEPTPAAEETVLRCAHFEVRPATRELRVDGQPVTVERRAFDLLVYLMRHSDRVIDKQELLREVWHSRPVSDSTLPQAVSRARKALGGDDPEAFIANVYGVGYRFAKPIQRIGGQRSTRASSSSPLLLWLTLAIALFALALALWQMWPSQTEPPDVRVAVLPVQNETGNAELEWVSYGVLPLIDRTLEDAGVSRVSSGTVLATLRRYPNETDPEAQARVLQLSTGADQVLVPRLSTSESGYRLSISAVGSPDDPVSFDVEGQDISMLAVAAGTGLSESLSRWKGSERARSSLVTDDPFINQAFARGLDARLRARYEDAARYFDTVLAAAPDLRQAKYHLSLVTRRMGDWDYTDQLNKELLASAQAEDDRGMLAAAQSVSGILAWRRGDKDEAENWYNQSLTNYQALDNQDYVASTKANLAILASTRGIYRQAEQLFLDALAHYQQGGDRYNEATTLKNLGNLYSDQGQFDTAETYLQQSLTIRQELGLPLQVALTLSVLADIDMARGHWPQALAYQQRVLAAAQEYKSPVLESQARSDLAACLRRLGRLEESRLMAAKALSIATELNSPSNQAFAKLQQGRTELALGHWQRASDLFAEAGEVYKEIEEPLGYATSAIARGEALLALSQTDLAESVINQAAGTVEQSQITRLDAALSRARSLVAQQRGDSAAAIRQLQEAYNLAINSDSPIDGLDIGGEYGQMLIRTDSDITQIETLASQLMPRAEASAPSLKFLLLFFRDRDPSRALDLAERRQRLLGEGWNSDDEQTLLELRRAISADD